MTLAPGRNARRHATSLVLVLLAVAAGIYALVIDRGRVGEAEQARRAHNVLPVYRREEVTRLALVRGDGTLVLERASGDGGMAASYRVSASTAPHPGPAEAAAVEKLLGALELASIVREVDGSAKELGLDAPRVRGTLTMGARTYRFALGGPAPTPEGAAYLRVDGAGTYVVARDLVAELTAHADTFRERALVRLAPADVTRLELRAAAPAVVLERMDALSFRVAGEKERYRASRARVDAALAALAELRAETFVADADAERAQSAAAGDGPGTGTGTGRGVVTIRVTSGSSPQPLELSLGADCPGGGPGVLARRIQPTPVSACVARSALDALSMGDAALRDLHLFAAREDEIEELRVELVPGGPVLDLARKGGGFRERAPRERDLGADESDAARLLVSALVAAEGELPGAVQVAPAVGASVASTPRARIRIVRADGLGEETVELVALDDRGGARVRRAVDGAILRVSPRVARLFEPSAVALRRRAVFPDAPDAHTLSALTSRCDGVEQRVVREAGALVMRAPQGQRVDVAAALDVANAVLRARVEAWVGDSGGAEWGLDRPSCRIDVTLEGSADAAPRTFALVFGEATEGGVYARDAGSGAVFVAPRALRDAAARLLVDRHVFHVAPETIARAELESGGARFSFVRVDGALTASRAAPDAGPRDAAETLAQVLETLQADEVAHLGPPRPEERLVPARVAITVELRGDAGVVRRRFVLGDTISVGDRRAVYARADGTNATFLVSRSRVAPLFALFEPLSVGKE